jgi:dihydroxy-acid dehydratase
MSGTAFGTIVLHVVPEAAVGGPLAHVRTGDRIRLSVSRRELTLLVGEQELARRTREAPPVPPAAERGYRKLFLATVTQADEGVDFDFLRPPKAVGRIPNT